MIADLAPSRVAVVAQRRQDCVVGINRDIRSGASMPNPIRTVIAASDFSFFAHRAARRAGQLARAHGAELHLLHVLDSSSAKALLRNSPALDLEAPLRFEAERALNSLADDVV